MVFFLLPLLFVLSDDMSQILQKVAQALKAANDELHAVIKYNVHHDTWEIWIRGKPVEVNFKIHDEAENRCEALNYEYAARKAVEALKGDVPYYECNKMWKELTSKEVWNLCLNQILKYDIHLRP